MQLWENNPHVSVLSQKIYRSVKMCYGRMLNAARTNSRHHFITAWHENFADQTGIKVTPQLPKPDLHLSDKEKKHPVVSGKYWLILSGGKSDFTTKHYVAARFQEVVHSLRGYGLQFVQAGNASDKHPVLDGCVNLVGKTSLRQFLNLIYHSQGVICTITAAMHAAAAFDKPCVVTAGGREEWWWEGYTNTGKQFGPIASGQVKVPHRFLHTIGLLSCCYNRGCWKNKTSRQERDDKKSYCVLPVVSGNEQIVPKCMDMITTENIIEAVMSYYTEGLLEL